MPETLEVWLRSNLAGLEHWALATDALTQGMVALAGLVLTFAIERALWPRMVRFFGRLPVLAQVAHLMRPLAFPLLWLILVALGIAACQLFQVPVQILEPLARLLLAWLVIRAVSLFIRNPDLALIFAVVAWVLVALRISGFLDPVTGFLDSLGFEVGTARISALTVIVSVLAFGVMIWGALFAARLFEKSLGRFPSMTPSAQVLLGKLTRILLLVIAFLIAMSSLGINLTALAFLGGAIGVGLGFGLQKVVSNLFSGVILLLDHSIKPGDVIEVGGSYGWINKLAARYTSVITRDGREHLIPNEDMITQTVINWTYSSTKIRRNISIPVSYKTDLRQAMALVLAAADETPRVLGDPEPKCLVREFADSAITLELRIWISDPQNGVRNVASDVMLRIWDRFRNNGIEFPYPQLDVHMVPQKHDE